MTFEEWLKTEQGRILNDFLRGYARESSIYRAVQIAFGAGVIAGMKQESERALVAFGKLSAAIVNAEGK